MIFRMKTAFRLFRKFTGTAAVVLMTNFYLIHAQDFWQPTPGPFCGSVRAFAANSKGKIFTASTFGYLYVSENFEHGWEAITGPGAITYPRAILINANDVIFVGSGGLYRSVDDGLNWQYLDMGVYMNISCIALNATEHVFTGSLQHGIYRSTDNGDSWSEVNNGLPVGENNYVQSIACNMNSGDLFAAIENQGIYYSDNNGESWNRLPLNLSQYSFGDMVITSPGEIFVATSLGIYKSANNGQTWSQLTTGIQTYGIYQLAISSSGDLFAGGTQGVVYRSSDGGSTWTRIDNNFTSDYIYDLFTMGSSYVYVGTERSGIFISSDNGQSWQQKNEGFRATTVNDLVCDSAGKIFSAHNGEGIYRSDNSGESWQSLYEGLDNPYVNDLEIVVDDTMLAATYGGVFETTDGGITWFSRNEDLPTWAVTALTLDRKNYIIYVALQNEYGIYKTTENWQNWVPANGGLNFTSSTYIRKIIWVPDDTQSGKLYVATTDWQDAKGIFRSVDGGSSWIAINEGLANLDVYSIAANHEGILFATTSGGGVYRSINGGDYWEQLATGWYEAIAFNSAGHIFISGNDGYNQGVFRSVDGGHSWEKYNSGIAQFNIKSLLVDDHDYIYAGLYSFSIFKGRVSTTINRPVPSFPAKDAVAQPIPLNFQWLPVSDATHYHFQLARDIEFSELISDDKNLQDAEIIIDALEHDTPYFWRVRAANEYSLSAWSAPSSFSTFKAGPQLLTPGNDAGGYDLSVGLDWQALEGADSYHLQIATDDRFQNIVREFETLANNSINISDLSHTTQYFWRVRSQLAEGLTDWSETWNFSTKLAPPMLNSPANLAVDVPINPNLTWLQIPEATAFWLQVSETNTFNYVIIHQTDITANEFTVADLDLNTTYFWRVAGMFNGHWGEWSEIWEFTTLTYPSSFQADKSFSFPDYNSPADYKSSDYRIIGLPGNSGQSLDQVLGEGSGELWTAYWDNGRTTDYMIPFSPGNSQFRFNVGKAFWIIYRGSWRFAAEVPTASLNTDNQATIPLHNGWNLITNPFPDLINWNVVLQANDLGTQPLWRFDKSFKQTQDFQPYEGYYFDNTSNRQYLFIPYAPGISKTVTTIKPDWQIAVTMNGSDYIDGPIFLGVSPWAESGVDALDHRKPRAPGDLPMIFFERSDWGDAFATMASDIRPPVQELDTWPFFVRTLTTEEFQLRFSGGEEVPDDLQIRLIDYQTMKAYDLRENPSYRLGQRPAGLNRFAVMVGNEAALNENLQQLQPNHFELGKNFPNPFNPATSIPLMLPERAEIRLTIYDLLGARIKTLFEGSLEAGQYLFGWDGTNASGERCPSGVYLYQLKTGTGIETTRKMLLIK